MPCLLSLKIKVFPDLPLVESMKGVKERFLVAIGVRKVVNVGLILEKLTTGESWSHVDLITYLARQAKYGREERQRADLRVICRQAISSVCEKRKLPSALVVVTRCSK